MGLITIATDYGSADGYTAVVKGVIKSIAPETEIIDVTDSLASVLKASIALYRYFPHFPTGTVHLVVIDPTVGTKRRALAGTDGRSFFVGPDNGVFSMVIRNSTRTSWYKIQSEMLPAMGASATFHGRDIFGPAAAMISTGQQLENLGAELNDPYALNIPEPTKGGNHIIGEIIDIDTFGNLIINIPGSILSNGAKVMLEGTAIPSGTTFADVSPGMAVAYIGSIGFLEIAVNRGRADERFHAGVGSEVMVRS